MSLERLFQNGQRVDGLWVNPKSGIIQFLKKINGEEVRFSTKVKMPKIQEARRIANQKLEEIFGKQKKKHSYSSLIKDEFPKYLAVKEAEGWSYRTIQKIKQAQKKIEPFWGCMLPNEITRDTGAEWISWLSEEFPGQQKFNWIKYMRNFSRYLAEKGLLPIVPRIVDPDAKKFKALRDKKKQRIFTPEEFKTVYYAAPGARERCVAMFMYTMGTRIEETLSLRFKHEILKVDRQWVYRWTIDQNKAGLTGQHLLHPNLVPLIEVFEKDLSGVTELLFPQARDVNKFLKPQQIDWDFWRKKANLNWHWTSHTFRHTCLSNLFNDQKNPQALICKLYRVSLAVAIETYVKPTKEGIEKMRNAIEINI